MDQRHHQSIVFGSALMRQAVTKTRIYIVYFDLHDYTSISPESRGIGAINFRTSRQMRRFHSGRDA